MTVFEGLSVGEKYFIKTIKILNIKKILNIEKNIKKIISNIKKIFHKKYQLVENVL